MDFSSKKTDPYYFSCPNYLSLWSYAPVKRPEFNFVIYQDISETIIARGLKHGQLIEDDE